MRSYTRASTVRSGSRTQTAPLLTANSRNVRGILNAKISSAYFEAFAMTKKIEGARFLAESERSKFISLKEAALITEYAPDYIGQLIREGKIEGQQVYTNVSWVTTEEAVRTYMRSKGKNEESKRPVPFWKNPQWYIYCVLYTVIGCLGCIFLLLCYIFFVSIDHKVGDASLKNFNVHTYAQ